MNKLFIATISSLTLLFAVWVIPVQANSQEDFEYYKGTILQTIEQDEISLDGFHEKEIYRKLEVEITDGDKKGEIVELEVRGLESYVKYNYHDGDKVILSAFESYDGTQSYSIVSYDRQNTLLILFLLFLTIALFVSSKKTIGSLLGLFFSFFIIFAFLIPRILDGGNPILLSILSAVFIIPVSFSLSHGANKKTAAAILSTIIALVITGVLATIFMSLASITGQGSEEAMFISMVINQKISIEGLLLAGVIIGTLGVLDDITISQVAIVEQISDVGKKLTKQEIFVRAMNIGKDHMASMINTLVLVYAGASMPILIIFVNSNLPLNYILSLETISMEIIRTLVGTIGLISAIPISTFLGTIMFKKT